jgi:hypothetical protein
MPNKKPLDINPFTPDEVQILINGAIDAIIDNKNYFYNSGVGPQYSHLTPAGEEMVIKSLSALLPLLAQAKERELDERAKQLTFESLKEEHDQ